MAEIEKYLRSLDDDALAELIIYAKEEQRQRALLEADTDALLEEGFLQGFDAKGNARQPWIYMGLIVCPGSRIDKSSINHDCTFVHLSDGWVWESSEKVVDSIRNVPGPKNQMRSVTILTAVEGLELDVITSRTKMGVHEMKRANSYQIKNSKLELVSTRAAKVYTHR